MPSATVTSTIESMDNDATGPSADPRGGHAANEPTDSVSPRLPGWALAVAGVALPLAVAVLSWWCWEAFAFSDTETEYATRPPSPTSAGRVAVLVVGLALLVGSVLVWGAAARTRRLRGDWWGVEALAVVGAAVVGGVWSLARLDTVTANIGGGIAVLFGLPLAGALLLAAAVWALVLAVGRRRRTG